MSEKLRVLVVEDEEGHALALVEALERAGYKVSSAADGQEGIDKFGKHDPHVVVTDLKLGGAIDGLGVLAEVVKSGRTCKVILITAHSSIDSCKAALREGAYDYIEKPIDLDLLRAAVKRAEEQVRSDRENRRLQDQLEEKFSFSGVVGKSSEMLQVMDMLRRAARSDVPVLLQGESGVGKELLARAIHDNSPRKSGPFQPVNCAGLADTLLESELFGHAKGAFTGAMTDRKGFFAMADGGTLFLDEIGDMPVNMQAKLLRILEDQTVVPVGATGGFKVDVRIISATNHDLEAAVQEKKFRQDLYYRIRGVDVEVPPLRRRRDDIALLAEYFVKQFAQTEERAIQGFTPQAMRALKSYDWPGNVRELRNYIKVMVVLAEKEKIDVGDLPFEMHRHGGEQEELGDLAGVNLTELEKTAIKRTLEMVDGNRELAAQMLGIGQRTLYRKIKEYGLGVGGEE